MHRRVSKIKRRTSHFRKKLIFGFALILFLVISLGSILTGFFLNTSFFVNPLSKERFAKNQSLEDILKKEKIEYSELKKFTDYYSVTIKDQGVVYISANKDFLKQVSSLQVIINRLTIEGKRFKKVDFRFDKPYITY